MEAHSTVNSVMAKRLWNVLRISFFMLRKGLISKRKLITEMNLLMKRGKLLRKSLGNLMHLHHHSRHMTRGRFGIQEYEFSCGNSPSPVFFGVPKRKHHYFPCINVPEVVEHLHEYPEEKCASELAPGDQRSPLLSPFAVRVSDYSSEEENDGGNVRVDDEAEEFIKRFYEQLRAQSRMPMLEYQEIQCQ